MREEYREMPAVRLAHPLGQEHQGARMTASAHRPPERLHGGVAPGDGCLTASGALALAATEVGKSGRL